MLFSTKLFSPVFYLLAQTYNLKHTKLKMYSNRIKIETVTFQFLTEASMKTTVFWDIAPCSLDETDRSFRGA
jgi:hypothetical protein